jgi:hypothetical protein
MAFHKFGLFILTAIYAVRMSKPFLIKQLHTHKDDHSSEQIQLSVLTTL